jgi:hypothetical protein
MATLLAQSLTLNRSSFLCKVLVKNNVYSDMNILNTKM